MDEKLIQGKLVACPKCGVKLPRALSVCPRDGTALAGEQPQQAASEAAARQVKQEARPAQPDEIFVAAPGTVIDNRYEILSLLGRGGMGSVYKAKHIVLNTTFAIKIVHPDRISRDSLQRFRLEAQAASLLKHPHIVGIHDFGITPEGMPYIAMEYLEGRSLAEIVHEDGLPDRSRFFAIIEQVCDALSHAHKQGIIHRDIKPANIFVCSGPEGQDIVKIVDFGMAKLLPRDGAAQPVRITATGEVLGSPLYMSPEQCTGAKLDSRTDIYSLAIVMHEVLTGSHIFNAESPLAVMQQHLNDTAEFQADTAVLKELQELVLKCLKKDPAQRYQSVEELQRALEQIKNDEASAGSELAATMSSSAKKQQRSHKLSLIPQLAIILSITAGFILLLISFSLHNAAPSHRTDSNIQSSKSAGRGPARSALTCYRQGSAVLKQGNIKEAIEKFTEAIAVNPSFPPPIKSRAEAFYQLEQYDKSIEDYSRLIKLEPESAQVYLLRAEAFFHNKQYQKTIEDCQKSMLLDPDNPRQYLTSGNAFCCLGYHNQALDAYTKAVKLETEQANPDSASYCARGNEYCHLKQFDKSFAEFEQAIKLNAGNGMAYASRGKAYQLTGKYQEAINDYNKAIAIDQSAYKKLLSRIEQCYEIMRRQPQK